MIARKIEDRRTEVQVLSNLGSAYNKLGDRQNAIIHYEQALRTAGEIRDRRGAGSASGNLGIIYTELGDRQKARTLLSRCHKIFSEIGYKQGQDEELQQVLESYEFRCRSWFSMWDR